MNVFEKLAAIAAKCPAPKPDAIVNRKGDEASLYLYEAITPEGFGGISAKAFVTALTEVQGVKTLNVHINCVGGAVYEAKAIYTALQNFPAHKVVYVDGLCASAATFIAMAADEIVTAPEATWMIHNAQGMTMGDATAHRDTADLLEMESANICAIYCKRTGCKESDVRAWMDAETFMNAELAAERCFTDCIAGEPQAKPKRATAAMPATHKIAATAAQTERQLAAAKMNIDLWKEKRKGASPNAKTGQPGRK